MAPVMVPPGLTFINPNITATGFQAMIAPPPPPPAAGRAGSPTNEAMGFYPGANPMHHQFGMGGFDAPPPPMSPSSTYQ